MIYSTQHNKNTNEDPRTSVVFENLMLLPDSVFWGILKESAANKGILPENAGLLSENFHFWPKWEPTTPYNTGNTNYVEPDVFFRFENFDVIVEAKYSDSNGQYREEWEREFKAYLNEYENDRKKVVLLAVGGNPTFEREPEIQVGKYKCPIVKCSWEKILETVLAFEKKELSIIENENQSSMKRIIRNIECGLKNNGIYKNNKKVEIKGINNLFVLGKIFQKVIYEGAKEQHTLKYFREDINKLKYGYQFEVMPKDDNKKHIWLSVAIWLEWEMISIEARLDDGWAGELCNQIRKGKEFISDYAEEPYFDEEYGSYYFNATDKFYQEFSHAQTFDAQVELVSKYIDEVCLYYLK